MGVAVASPPVELSSRTELDLSSPPPEVAGVPVPPLRPLDENVRRSGAGGPGKPSPRIAEWFTPRQTPREPEPRELTVCMVREKFDAPGEPLGVRLEGALVAELTGLALRHAENFDFSLKQGDVLLSVSGSDFESGRELTSYLKPKQRAYAVRVRRMVVPPRAALSARIYRGLVSISGGGPLTAPQTEEEMEMALLEWEYFRPQCAHPEEEDAE